MAVKIATLRGTVNWRQFRKRTRMKNATAKDFLLLCPFRNDGACAVITKWTKSSSILETENLGHAQTPSPITDAKIGKVFHDCAEKTQPDHITTGEGGSSIPCSASPSR